MAGLRTNLAVTKDGEAYNKLQRPNDFLDRSAASTQANKRKQTSEQGAIDKPVAWSFPGNKRAKTQHATWTAKVPQPSDDRRQYRSGGPIAECGMRTTLPIDEEEAEFSDDSLGDALAYLRSVRSEASAIPHLLVAADERQKDTDTTRLRASTAGPITHAFYEDGAWVAVDESYEATYDGNEDYALEHPDPRCIYHKQLVRRFQGLRQILSRRCSNRASRSDIDVEQLPSEKIPSNRHEWLYTIDREFPTLSQICQLDDKSVRRGLEYCAHAMARFETISSQKSCWIWTLLALSGDIGTLDSQKMSHIRDLGVKAGEMSVDLHSGSARQTNERECDHVHSDSAGQKPCDKPEAASCDTDGNNREPEAGYVQACAGVDLHFEVEKTHKKVVSRSQHNPQPHISSPGASGNLTDSHEGTKTDTSDDALERARARLLAQLGDNLIQAGIPSSSIDTDETQLQHLARPEQVSAEPPPEVQIRVIPSRAEAERQRQLMRAQESATASLRKDKRPSAETSATLCSLDSDNSSDDIDPNTRATIDMILTVAAECYGQRDLLKFRKPW